MSAGLLIKAGIVLAIIGIVAALVAIYRGLRGLDDFLNDDESWWQ